MLVGNDDCVLVGGCGWEQIGFFDIGTDCLFLASIWDSGHVSAGVKAGLLLFIVVSPFIYFGIGAYHYIQSNYDPKEFRRRLPIYFCTYYVNSRYDAWLPFHVLALLIDTALITVRIPFFVSEHHWRFSCSSCAGYNRLGHSPARSSVMRQFLAFLPNHLYYDSYADFTRRFVGLEAAFEALPQVILQSIATAQLGKITPIFIASVTFSALAAFAMVVNASCEVCGDWKKIANRKHGTYGP